MKLRALAVALLLGGVFLLAPVAWAEEGASEDLKAKIQKKMAEIRELMRKNEAALLELSVGKTAKTKRIDVPVPDGEQGSSGTDGGAGGSGGAKGAGTSGEEAAKKLGELVETSRASKGRIPDELKRLVEMIPL